MGVWWGYHRGIMGVSHILGRAKRGESHHEAKTVIGTRPVAESPGSGGPGAPDAGAEEAAARSTVREGAEGGGA
jgi:hypothetical protein